MNGGLILPGDISIYLRGLDPEECQTDEIEGKWTFPFPADYKFLGAKVGKKILRAFGFIFPTTLILFYKQHMIKKTSWTILEFVLV